MIVLVTLFLADRMRAELFGVVREWMKHDACVMNAGFIGVKEENPSVHDSCKLAV